MTQTSERLDQPASVSEFAVGRYWQKAGFPNVRIVIVSDLRNLFPDNEKLARFIVVNSRGSRFDVGCEEQLTNEFKPLPSCCTGFDWTEPPQNWTPCKPPKKITITFEPITYHCGWCHEPLETVESTKDHSNTCTSNPLVQQLAAARAEVERLTKDLELQDAIRKSNAMAMRDATAERDRLLAELTAIKEVPKEPRVGDWCMFRRDTSDKWHGPSRLRFADRTKNYGFVSVDRMDFCEYWWAARLATPAELSAAGIQQEQPK